MVARPRAVGQGAGTPAAPAAAPATGVPTPRAPAAGLPGTDDPACPARAGVAADPRTRRASPDRERACSGHRAATGTSRRVQVLECCRALPGSDVGHPSGVATAVPPVGGRMSAPVDLRGDSPALVVAGLPARRRPPPPDAAGRTPPAGPA